MSFVIIVEHPWMITTHIVIFWWCPCHHLVWFCFFFVCCMNIQVYFDSLWFPGVIYHVLSSFLSVFVYPLMSFVLLPFCARFSFPPCRHSSIFPYVAFCVIGSCLFCCCCWTFTCWVHFVGLALTPHGCHWRLCHTGCVAKYFWGVSLAPVSWRH